MHDHKMYWLDFEAQGHSKSLPLVTLSKSLPLVTLCKGFVFLLFKYLSQVSLGFGCLWLPVQIHPTDSENLRASSSDLVFKH